MQPPLPVGAKKKKLGEILLEGKVLTPDQLQKALAEQRSTGETLGSILIRHRFVSEEVLGKALAVQYGTPYMNLGEIAIPPDVLKLIPESLVKRHLVLPLQVKNGTLTVAMQNPGNIALIDEIQLVSRMTVVPVVSSINELQSAINRSYEARETAQKAIEKAVQQGGVKQEEAQTPVESTDNVGGEDAPIIQLVNSIIVDAINKRASDIHIEPQETKLVVRFRIDGILHLALEVPKAMETAVASRLKVLANLNITEYRRPQDGRFSLSHHRKKYDFRISTMPVIFGEKIVIRILRSMDIAIGMESLGLSDPDLVLLQGMVGAPHGIVLVTGPTGSGKTTTLYAGLQQIDRNMRNIITVEDPVEYPMRGINQINVNHKIGLTFASALRSILRQDPDVVMLGEIRDEETMTIAIEASLTGHLVLSTLHTNDAASTVSRLLEMGVPPYLITATLLGVIAQRLVRRNCANCLESYEASVKEREFLQYRGEFPLILKRGKGCNQCHQTGYRERVGLYEIMTLSRKLKELIEDRRPSYILKQQALNEGMHTLLQDGREKVMKGMTTVDEVQRVVGGEDGGSD